MGPTQAVALGPNQTGVLTWQHPTISYRGRPVACATATRFFLTDALERLPAGDPLLTLVLYMCAYARDVHTGELR